MKISTDVANVLAQADRVCDYVPFISTISNLIDLFEKAVILPKLEPAALSNHYWRQLNEKSVSRCWILLVPVIGNVFMALKDFFGFRKGLKVPTGLPAETIERFEVYSVSLRNDPLPPNQSSCPPSTTYHPTVFPQAAINVGDAEDRSSPSTGVPLFPIITDQPGTGSRQIAHISIGPDDASPRPELLDRKETEKDLRSEKRKEEPPIEKSLRSVEEKDKSQAEESPRSVGKEAAASVKDSVVEAESKTGVVDCAKVVNAAGVETLKAAGARAAEYVAASAARRAVRYVCYQGAKGALESAAPIIAENLPGLGTLSAAYKVGKAVAGADSVDDAYSRGLDAVTDITLSMACVAAGQAMIPVPVLGGFLGGLLTPLAIAAKNRMFPRDCKDSSSEQDSSPEPKLASEMDVSSQPKLAPAPGDSLAPAIVFQ